MRSSIIYLQDRVRPRPVDLLRQAAYQGDENALVRALEAGADPKEGNGYALYVAISLGHECCVDLLLTAMGATPVVHPPIEERALMDRHGLVGSLRHALFSNQDVPPAPEPVAEDALEMQQGAVA